MQLDPDTQRSLAFWLGLFLLAGQFTAYVAIGVKPSEILVLATLACIFGPGVIYAFFGRDRGE